MIDSLLSLYNEILFSFDEKVRSSLLKLNKADKNIKIPLKEILIGLKFAKNRWRAKDAGTLKVGRKSIIQKEIHSITPEQATWRLINWKLMMW